MRAPSAGPGRPGGSPPPPPPPPPPRPPTQRVSTAAACPSLSAPPGLHRRPARAPVRQLQQRPADAAAARLKRWRGSPQALPAGPFKSRRDIALTALGGSAALWLVNHSERPLPACAGQGPPTANDAAHAAQGLSRPPGRRLLSCPSRAAQRREHHPLAQHLPAGSPAHHRVRRHCCRCCHPAPPAAPMAPGTWKPRCTRAPPPRPSRACGLPTTAAAAASPAP
jgi:hypothetical protein